MLEVIVEEHSLGPSLWELSSCFYLRNQELEETFCLPYTHHTNGSSIGRLPFGHLSSQEADKYADGRVEITYSIKYPEFKEKDNRWVIRHTGLFHRYDAGKRQSLYVLFSPHAKSQVQEAAEFTMLSPSSGEGPFWLHETLFQTHISSWRRYIASEDEKLLPIVSPGSLASIFLGTSTTDFRNRQKLSSQHTPMNQ